MSEMLAIECVKSSYWVTNSIINLARTVFIIQNFQSVLKKTALCDVC